MPSRRKPDRYLELIRRFPLRPIRSEKELDQAIRVVDSLLDRALEPEEKDYLDVLSDQISAMRTRTLKYLAPTTLNSCGT